MDDKTFSLFYKERINRIIDRLKDACEDRAFWSETIRSGIASDLYEVFHRAAVRCLIAEIHVCKNAGMLLGKTAREEYDSYCCLLADSQYRAAVYEKYPGLLQYLDELEKIQLYFWEELIERLINDWEEIKDYFQLDTESRVLSVRRSGSDFHCGGKSVVIIETDQKKRILYKPHSLTNEIFLQNLLSDVYRDLGFEKFQYLELEKINYGWVEEVTWEKCKSKKEVAAFYKRTGVLAAVAYVLGIGDLHYENIIAHGELPVIVDAETLFQHMDPLYQWTEKTTNFYSVLSSGLFPGGTADLNTAGITGGRIRTLSKKLPIVMYDKTSDICIGYQEIFVPQSKNQVEYQGEVICWYDYREEMIEGFRLTYRWFCRKRDSIFKKICERKELLKSRYLSGETHFFGLSLFASVHPELMSSKDGRLRYLQKLCKDRTFGKQEIEAMLRGDIPYFWHKLIDCEVYDGKEAVARHFLDVAVEEKLKQRMQSLSYEDCMLQEKVIAYSCRVFEADSHAGKAYNEAVSEDEVIRGKFDSVESAKNIADYIMENSIRQKDKIFWLGIEEENEIIKIKPVDIYFYSGIAGIAVFFRKMNWVCGLYEEVCEKLERMLFSYTERVLYGKIHSVTEYPGMYCGEGSVVYAYQLLYQITGIKSYREYADAHAGILMKCVKQEAPFDLLYGNAGAVLALCRQYVDTRNITYLCKAHIVLEYLDHGRIKMEQGITWFEKAEENPVCSMAHGNSGVLLAYARVQSLDSRVDYFDRIKQIIRFEDHFFDYGYGNWADLRKKGEDRWKTYAWCNGGIGVVAARMQAAMWNPEIKEVLLDNQKVERLINGIIEQREMSLCHGNLGNDIICGIFFNNRTKKNKLYGKDFIKYELMQCGFMNGMSGIGIGILLLKYCIVLTT